MRKINWFEIDMETFELLYNNYLEAEQAFFDSGTQLGLCSARECGHPPFKNDGTEDKRSKCDAGKGWDAYNQMCKAGWNLEYANGNFFQAIGLEPKRSVVTTP